MIIAELPSNAEQKARWASVRPFVGGIIVDLHGTSKATGSYLIECVHVAETIGL